jgi:hypothetical protein
LTRNNKAFIEEVVHDQCGAPAVKSGIETYNTPLKIEPLQPLEITTSSKRTGLIGKIIGQYPLWMKNGEKCRTTLVQVTDLKIFFESRPIVLIYLFLGINPML